MQLAIYIRRINVEFVAPVPHTGQKNEFAAVVPPRAPDLQGEAKGALVEVVNSLFLLLKIWRARNDSNVRPSDS